MSGGESEEEESGEVERFNERNLELKIYGDRDRPETQCKKQFLIQSTALLYVSVWLILFQKTIMTTK